MLFYTSIALLMTWLPSISPHIGQVDCDAIPPSLYCKNQDLAQHCDKNNMCWKIQQKSYGKRVHMTLLYETLCPDSQRFLPKFVDFYQEYANFVDLELVPFGNAEYAPNGQLICQHGEAECQANKMHACAIYYVPNPLIFLNCSMLYLKYNFPLMDAVRTCQIYLTINDMRNIKYCFESGMGDQLLRTHRERTKNGWPERHLGVPWMFFNNVSMRAAQFHMHDLSGAICDWYQGNMVAPKRCDKLS